MEKAKLDRINELARKQRTVGLDENEKLEQADLRLEYLKEIRASFGAAQRLNALPRIDDAQKEKLHKKTEQKES